jgi:hypothetical protein
VAFRDAKLTECHVRRAMAGTHSPPEARQACHRGLSQHPAPRQVCHRGLSQPPAPRQVWRGYLKSMPDTKELMLQLASESVWLVMALPWTVKLLKWTPVTFTLADFPCRLIVFFTSELTLVK